MPIHHLMVKHNVTAFFHGHDHLYAKQDLDGVVYQEVPQPGNSRARDPSGRYGYTHGEILPGSGYLRVQVSPAAVKTEFMRTDGGAGRLAHAYTVAPRLKNASQSATASAGSKFAPAPAVDNSQRRGRRPLGSQPGPARP